MTRKSVLMMMNPSSTDSRMFLMSSSAVRWSVMFRKMPRVATGAPSTMQQFTLPCTMTGLRSFVRKVASTVSDSLAGHDLLK